MQHASTNNYNTAELYTASMHANMKHIRKEKRRQQKKYG